MKKVALDESLLNRQITSNTTFRLHCLKEIVLAHFQVSSEEVIVMHSEKMKAKYMKEDMWKSCFRERAGWHFATSYGLFSFLYKMLENHLWNSFLLYLMFQILQLLHEISSLPVLLYKKGFLKNSSKFTNKHKKQSSGVVMSKDILTNFAKFTGNHLCQSLFFNKVAGWRPEAVRSSHWRCSAKQGVLKSFANFTRKNRCWSVFLINLQFWGPGTLSKKTSTQGLSCEIWILFKNNNFQEHLWTSASKLYLERDSFTGVFLWILWIIQEHLLCRGSANGWFWKTSAWVSL